MSNLGLSVIIILLGYMCFRLYNKNKEIKEQAEKEISNIKAAADGIVNEVRHNCEEEIRSIKKQAAEDIVLEREKVESDKSKLMEKNEKELLVEAVQALSMYGEKVFRLEKSIQMLANELASGLEEINKSSDSDSDDDYEYRNRVFCKLEEISDDVNMKTDDIQRKLEEMQGYSSVGNTLTDIMEELTNIKNEIH